MASLASIRNEIAAVLQAALPAYSVHARPLSTPEVPSGEVAQFEIEKHQAMGNGAEWWLCVCRAYVAAVDDEVSQELADALLENDPVSAALETYPVLTSLVADLQVDRAAQRFWDHPTVGMIVGVEWSLRLLV